MPWQHPGILTCVLGLAYTNHFVKGPRSGVDELVAVGKALEVAQHVAVVLGSFPTFREDISIAQV